MPILHKTLHHPLSPRPARNIHSPHLNPRNPTAKRAVARLDEQVRGTSHVNELLIAAVREQREQLGAVEGESGRCGGGRVGEL